MRKIIHVDMDAFFAAIEQRDALELRGLPIAVGSGGERGVVMTASYEARRFGVGSAMPSVRAKRLCPDLIFVRPRFDAYKSASRTIRAIFARFTELVEPLSLDEAFLDVTRPKGEDRPASLIAAEIKRAIVADTGLTASAGVSFNKFLAKIASDMDKPDGLTVIRPEAAEALLARLPVERFHGIGPATARRLHRHGLRTGADLKAVGEPFLVAAFGNAGRHFWQIVHGLDGRPVEPRRQRRSLSIETTFAHDLEDPVLIRSELGSLAQGLFERLRLQGYQGRTLTLKIKYRDFRIRTRRLSTPRPVASGEEILKLAEALLARAPLEAPVRLLGLGVSSQAESGPGAQLALPLSLQG